MNQDAANRLRPGDEVFWDDPDGGACSRVLKIHAIKIVGDVASIMEVDGSVIEVYLRELR